MSNLRQAAEMALNALENHTAIKHPQQIHYRDAAIEALRTALAEPEHEPLTDEEIEVLAMDIDGTPKIYLEFARDIEWAHGIKREA